MVIIHKIVEFNVAVSNIFLITLSFGFISDYPIKEMLQEYYIDIYRMFDSFWKYNKALTPQVN